MTADAKTPLEQVNVATSQLKEMRHYFKTYVEQLTAQWLLFDGPLKKLKQAGKFEDLMTRQPSSTRRSTSRSLNWRSWPPRCSRCRRHGRWRKRPAVRNRRPLRSSRRPSVPIARQ